MPLQLEVKRKLCTRTDRVKCVSFHPTESWILSSLYSGCAQLYNYETQVNVKTFEVSNVPVRSGIFVVRKSWVVFGSDDMFVRVFNYNTMEKVKEFEAHSDYLRSIVAHPNQPLLLTSSDDMTIKLWDWDQKWTLKQTFEGHVHYVMQIELNPKDLSTFASASMDRTVKVWNLGSARANFTLEGHLRGVNCVSYFATNTAKPYLLSGGDDNAIKIWDYQNKSCVQTINAHFQNINFVACHQTLPFILSGSEDGTIKCWNSSTYRMENMLNYGLERCWTGCLKPNGSEVAFGYDVGTVVVLLGRDRPAASMDPSGSKVVWAKHNVIHNATIAGVAVQIPDGSRLPVSAKELGSCEVYPATLSHSPNGRFIAVCGDGEYIIYTALALRNKAYGQAQDFVWAYDPSYFATRQGNQVIMHKNFKESLTIRVNHSACAMHGGRLLGVQSKDGLEFYDWIDRSPADVLCRIEISASFLSWSEDGQRLVISSEDDNCFFVLNVDLEEVRSLQEDPDVNDQQQVLNLHHEIPECATSGVWYRSEIFIYTTRSNKLNYYVDGYTINLTTHLDRNAIVLGYSADDNRIVLMDKDLSCMSRKLDKVVLDYLYLIVHNELNEAEHLIPNIPDHYKPKLAQFLQTRKLYREALAITSDISQKFEIALILKDLDLLSSLADSLDTEFRWKQLSSVAISKGRFDLFETGLRKAGDLSTLLIYAKCTGNRQLMRDVGELAIERKRYNIAFTAFFILADASACLRILLECKRFAEAVYFCNVYLPSRLEESIILWKENMNNPRIARLIPTPSKYPNLFPRFAQLLELEKARD